LVDIVLTIVISFIVLVLCICFWSTRRNYMWNGTYCYI